MKKIWIVQLVLLSLIVTGFGEISFAQEIKKENCFFLSSLHYTTKGMEHWYDKANGGIEIISGVPYSNLVCKNCHAPGCDRCHKVAKDGKSEYSTKTAKNQDLCLGCHSAQKVIMGIDSAAKQEDVHFAKGMKCMDCHSSREVHGDGTEYVSLKQPGAMDTRCEKCHRFLNPPYKTSF